MFSAIIEIAASLMSSYYNNNMPLLHAFTFFEFCTFTILFYRHFEYSAKIKKLILVAFLFFIPVAISETFIYDGLWKFNSVTRTYESLVLVTISLIYYYHYFHKNQLTIVWDQPMFWFTTAIFIYFSLDQFFFMLVNYLIAIDPSIQRNGVLMHATINIFANIIISLSFLCFRKPTMQ